MSEADELGLDFFIAATRPSRQDTTFRQIEAQRDPNMSRGLAWAETITAPDAARVDMLARAMAAKQAREREDQLTADRRAREDELLKKKWDREDALAEASKQIALDPYEPEVDLTYMSPNVKAAAKSFIDKYNKRFGDKMYAKDEAEAKQILAARQALENNLSRLVSAGVRDSTLKRTKAATDENIPEIEIRDQNGVYDPVSSAVARDTEIENIRRETGLTPLKTSFLLGFTKRLQARNALADISRKMRAGGKLSRQNIDTLTRNVKRDLDNKANLESKDQKIRDLVNQRLDEKDLITRAVELGGEDAELIKLEGTDYYAVINPDTGAYYVLKPSRLEGKAGGRGYEVDTRWQ